MVRMPSPLVNSSGPSLRRTQLSLKEVKTQFMFVVLDFQQYETVLGGGFAAIGRSVALTPSKPPARARPRTACDDRTLLPISRERNWPRHHERRAGLAQAGRRRIAVADS
jgi:hypothetical protein